MLAIKECLIREGVLNLNPPNLTHSSSFHHTSQQFDNTPYTLYSNRYSFGSKLDLLGSTQKSISDNSVSDLNSANSATAKTSCQQQQQLLKPIQSQSQQSTQPKKLPKRYQGHHPHFHHHTAPAYYTDLHLKIHTPEAKDSVNENYQSVYRTPSKLIKDEHQFPKTATATVAPPPISQKSTREQDKAEKESLRASFFRGDCIGQNDQRIGANEPYMISKSKSLNPTKGNSPANYILIDDSNDDDDENHLPLTANPDGSVVFACTNFKPCVTTVETVALGSGELQPQISNTRTGRNPQRFANRKRAVRVRSESRPISALYDIICKEKGLDVATTTNDEDSSPQHSYDEKTLTAPKTRRSHSRSVSRQTKSLLNSNNMSNMSSGLANSPGVADHNQHKATALQQKKRNDKYSPNTIFINDLSDDDDDDGNQNGDTTNRRDDQCSRKNFRLRNSHKKSNLLDELKQAKSSSLPPGLVNLTKFSPNHYQADSSRLDTHHNHASIMSKKSNPSSKSNSLLSSSTSSTALNVDPPLHLHLSSETLQQVCNDQKTGAGTTYYSSNKKSQHHQSPQVSSAASPKADRFSRKHRRLRDEKQRRHTDGAIKLYPSDLNDVQNNYDDDDDHDHADDHDNDYDDDDGVEEHHLQFHDLNGAGHDFHNLAANTANAKRYITRSQRINPNEATTSLSTQNLAVLDQQQQDLSIPPASSTANNPATIDTNGHYPSVEEMTNNSGKNSNTTPTTTANVKELKIRIPLTSDLTTAASAATTFAPPCSSITDKKKDEEKQHQQRFTSPTSPKPQHHSQQQRNSPLSSLDIQKAPSGSDTEHNKMSSTNSSPTNRVGISNKKLVPTVSVSMKQNLSETHCTASRSNSIRSNANSPKSPKPRSQTTECTVTITASPKVKQKQQHNNASLTGHKSPNHIDGEGDGELDLDDDFIEINDLPSNTFDDSCAGITARPRCSTMYTDSSDKSKSSSLSNGGHSKENFLALSPVHKSRTSDRSPNRRTEDRDKSLKRKSNLNRSLNEEATPDSDESALRRRRRREMGMSRPLVPNDDAALKAIISPNKSRVDSPPKPAIRNDLAYHMEMARKGLDLATTSSERRRAQTASPKNPKENPSLKTGINPSRISKRSDTVAIGDLRKERSNEVNRKMNERTRSGLEEIMKILENANECSTNAANAISDITHRLKASQEKEQTGENLMLPNASAEERRPSPVKHATFQQEECIYYEPDPLQHLELPSESAIAGGGNMLRSQRMLKAKSIERETAAYEPARLSPILRRKSTDDRSNVLSQPGAGVTVANTRNHIVSILKKKDHLSAGDSSSASSNASPVTFSSSVVDTPSKHKRAGILKKRSSLDESRYYSRSHSPDERSILIKSVRRNSLEEVANGGSSSSSSAQGHHSHPHPHHHHHGILKQSSYDSSKSDGCPSATREPLQPHSILKKKDSTSTPSDGGDHAPKHVSISQAVILAAAELSAAVETGDKSLQEDFTPNNEEYDIKPILKLDSSTGEDSIYKPPKPILKKKSSGDSDEHEIKPILKTSRKSSREEFDMAAYSDGESQQQEPLVRPILKTDSPSKRRSLGEPPDSCFPVADQERQSLSPSFLKRRTRSLERHDQPPVIDLAAALNAIATSQEQPNELISTLTNSTAGSSGGGANNVSVAERIKSVEKFLANQTVPKSSPSDNSPCAANSSWESPLQNHPNASVSGEAAAGGVKILKPSVIRRDLLKDRYKTQPVTSDEKNFFKNNISLVDSLPSGSAFKPAQSLEGLGFAHLSSHGNQSPNAPPSAFTLTRSFTQPLQTLSSSLHSPPQSSSSFKTGVPVPLPRKSASRSHLYSHDTVNSTLSFTGDSGLSCTNNSNSEQRIFEMSGLEQDVDMVEDQEPKTPLNKESSSTGVVRTSSVRARANMFQQMQEKTQSGVGPNREERTSPKRVPRRLSPSPVNSNKIDDEPKTPNNPPVNPDDEIASSSSNTLAPNESPRGILKSKSGGVGFMPMDLSNELKNRLKSSKHATVGNLRKSATTSNAAPIEQPLPVPTLSSTSASHHHDDTVSLVRNLTNLGKPPPPQLRDPMKMDPDIASASEGESSGGREISEIIKNSAVARRRKFNEGFLYPKMKNHPPPTTAQFWPYKQNPHYVQQQQQQLQQKQQQQYK